ncbi:MAG: hypothetical protein J6B89_03080 [Bacilli bacterium]|nr:hypothetical protein [Bacilli bacterium]
MKAKNIFIFIFSVLFILFISLYVTQATGYYEFNNSKKTTLTNDAIKKFEKDIKEGKQISAKNYLEGEKEYNNKISTTSLKISKTIEKSFNYLMGKLFEEINSAVSN